MGDFTVIQGKKKKPHHVVWAGLIISNGIFESPEKTLSFIQTELHRAGSWELLVFRQLVCKIACPSDQKCFRTQSWT